MATVIKVESKWFGEEVKKLADKLVGKSAFDIGLVVEAQAKELSPIKTGRLAGSIQTAGQDGKRTSPADAADIIQAPDRLGEVYVGTPVEYAPYMEYGTRFTPAQAFLRPALDIAKGKAPEIVIKDGEAVFAEYLQ